MNLHQVNEIKEQGVTLLGDLLANCLSHQMKPRCMGFQILDANRALGVRAYFCIATQELVLISILRTQYFRKD